MGKIRLQNFPLQIFRLFLVLSLLVSFQVSRKLERLVTKFALFPGNIFFCFRFMDSRVILQKLLCHKLEITSVTLVLEVLLCDFLLQQSFVFFVLLFLVFLQISQNTISCITEFTHELLFFVRFPVQINTAWLHDFVALFTLHGPLNTNPVFDPLVVNHTVLGEELQGADAAVVGEVLEGQLGHVGVQRLSVRLGAVHLWRCFLTKTNIVKRHKPAAHGAVGRHAR